MSKNFLYDLYKDLPQTEKREGKGQLMSKDCLEFKLYTFLPHGITFTEFQKGKKTLLFYTEGDQSYKVNKAEIGSIETTGGIVESYFKVE